MKKVAFICVHNSCRSQINQDAVRIMKELYGIDMDYFSTTCGYGIFLCICTNCKFKIGSF